MAEILSIGTTAAVSPDFTLVGESSSLLLTNTSGLLISGAYADIEAKTEATTAGDHRTVAREPWAKLPLSLNL